MLLGQELALFVMGVGVVVARAMSHIRTYIVEAMGDAILAMEVDGGQIVLRETECNAPIVEEQEDALSVMEREHVKNVVDQEDIEKELLIINTGIYDKPRTESTKS